MKSFIAIYIVGVIESIGSLLEVDYKSDDCCTFDEDDFLEVDLALIASWVMCVWFLMYGIHVAILIGLYANILYTLRRRRRSSEFGASELIELTQYFELTFTVCEFPIDGHLLR